MSIRKFIPSPLQPPLRYLLTRVRQIRHLLALLWTFFTGYLVFWWTRSTSLKSFFSMRELYCLTNGRFNKLLGSFAGMMYPPYRIEEAHGVLGDLKPN